MALFIPWSKYLFLLWLKKLVVSKNLSLGHFMKSNFSSPSYETESTVETLIKQNNVEKNVTQRPKFYNENSKRHPENGTFHLKNMISWSLQRQSRGVINITFRPHWVCRYQQFLTVKEKTWQKLPCIVTSQSIERFWWPVFKSKFS